MATLTLTRPLTRGQQARYAGPVNTAHAARREERTHDHWQRVWHTLPIGPTPPGGERPRRWVWLALKRGGSHG